MAQTCKGGSFGGSVELAQANIDGWLVATSLTHFVKVYRTTKDWVGFSHDYERIENHYSSEFILDEWREKFASNPSCVGNHRTHEAAVNCGIRYAKRVGLKAQRLEDAHYV